MKCFSVGHLSDEALVRRLRESVARDRATNAEMLQLIAEIDTRRLYARTRHDSMFAWCTAELGMSEDMAAKRIHAARAARRAPEAFAMVADGRLTLSALGLLAPHLEPGDDADLLAAATHRTNEQVRELLAKRFPRPDLPALVVPLAPPAGVPTLVPGTSTSPPARHAEPQHAVRHVAPPESTAAPTSKVPDSPWPKVEPLAPQRYGYQFTLGRVAHEKLGYAQALLGHAVPSGDLPQVIERALDALIEKLERAKLGKRSRSAQPSRTAKRALAAGERRVPDRVKNAVWERDEGQCTFVDSAGRRCGSRTRLEFDHVTPIARGGLSTAANLRLRCRTHNQYEARRVLGAAFVQGRVEKARRRAAELGRGPKSGAAPTAPPPAPA